MPSFEGGIKERRSIDLRRAPVEVDLDDLGEACVDDAAAFVARNASAGDRAAISTPASLSDILAKPALAAPERGHV